MEKIKISSTFLLILVSATLYSQKPDPVHWNYTAKKVSEGKFELRLTATLDDGWHIYSQTQPVEAIAEPTKINFNKNPLLALTGKPREIGTKEKYEDKAAGIVQYQYGNKVDFLQTVSLKAKANTNIGGTVTYQVCTNEMCLPPKTVSFSVAIE